MKLFYTQGFHITPLCTNKETIILFTKATMSSFRTVFSQSSTGVLNLFLSEDALCVSQSDKALVLVDISHCISTSQLEELVHSVICQQVLRLCQKQWYKRQSSNRGALRQNGGWWANWQEVYHHPLNHLQRLFLTCLWPTSTHQPLSAGGSPAQEAENSDLIESVKETLTRAPSTSMHNSYPHITFCGQFDRTD